MIGIKKELYNLSKSYSKEILKECVTLYRLPAPYNIIQSYKLEALSLIFNQISESFGVEKIEECRKAFIVECLLENWEEIFSQKYPDCVQQQFMKTSKRILAMCQSSEKGWGEYNEDVYWKDLAIARQQMFPAGAQVVEAYSGFGLQQGLKGSILQYIRFIRMVIHNKGKTGYYQIHTHTPELGEFNEIGWYDCYIRIAEMLKINKKIKGIFGSSWFYDPFLAEISPRLMYLQRVPLDNGAERFYIGIDRTGNAFTKSKTRFQLYNEGKYIPKSYLIVWSRGQILKWANSFRHFTRTVRS